MYVKVKTVKLSLYAACTVRERQCRDPLPPSGNSARFSSGRAWSRRDLEWAGWPASLQLQPHIKHGKP
jgi:hypothetical protein